MAVAAIAGYGLAVRQAGEDVRGSASVEFVTTDVPEPAVPTPPPSTAPKAEPNRRTTVSWPTYGYDVRRLRFAPGIDLRPPFRRIWTFRGRALLEFPPAVAYGRLYLPTFDGRFYALDARTGKEVWATRTNGAAGRRLQCGNGSS